MSLSIFPLTGIGDVAPGDDLGELLIHLLERAEHGVVTADVIVVTHKIVSKSEGSVVVLENDGPDAHRSLVEDESEAILRRRGDLVISVTRHGFVCANAGVDRSNTDAGTAVLLPRDPDRSAHRLRRRLEAHFGVRFGVVVSDTFGRPWRRGLTDVALGLSGLPAILDLKGTQDMYGRELEVTEIAIADEIAAAADLVMGKADGVPAALIRGLDLALAGSKDDFEHARGTDLIRPPSEDLFR